MEKHQELVARLEVTTEGSRELDVLIGSVTGYRNRFTGQLLCEALADPEMHDEALQWEGVPYYTTSLDAAVALARRVLPGWDWSVTTITTSFGGLKGASALIVHPDHPDGRDITTFGEAATPALALCIAILKATA